MNKLNIKKNLRKKLNTFLTKEINMNKLEKLHDWVHHNFWKYQAITKIPLVIIVAIVWVKIL